MAQIRKHANRELPPNLYNRGGYFSYRDPLSEREFGLGRNRRDAINQAIEANIKLMQDNGAVRLVDRLDGSAGMSFHSWLDKFEIILAQRKLSGVTLKNYSERIVQIKKHFHDVTLKRVTTQQISNFLKNFTDAGKDASARLYRSFFIDMFKEAMLEGHISMNPALITRSVNETVQRQRMKLEDFYAIRDAISNTAKWGDLIMDLALVTGQRRGDVIKMAWSDIDGDRLKVIQGKTGAKLLLPLNLTLRAADLSLGSILERCKSQCGDMGYIVKNRAGNMLNADYVTTIFSEARDSLKLEWDGTPATFHEIRSLSARLYKKEVNDKFCQRLLGHKSAAMTATYHDERDEGWVVI